MKNIPYYWWYLLPLSPPPLLPSWIEQLGVVWKSLGPTLQSVLYSWIRYVLVSDKGRVRPYRIYVQHDSQRSDLLSWIEPLGKRLSSSWTEWIDVRVGTQGPRSTRKKGGHTMNDNEYLTVLREQVLREGTSPPLPFDRVPHQLWIRHGYSLVHPLRQMLTKFPWLPQKQFHPLMLWLCPGEWPLTRSQRGALSGHPLGQFVCAPTSR